ncbi:MAG TPA: methylated-DNA--[protein]-cysteine S-methyltransferase [Polyangia bacterium]|jgi:methylated-DNA-[protein]-cysteine S-methyltransferase|nr:methylated-DNA--[protein]-cysteine S-methyltransferase [Polyangia bacterium]
MTNATVFSIVPTPVGPLMLVGEGDALVGVYFDNAALSASPPREWSRDDRRLRPAARQLAAYFAGTRTTFDVPLAPRGTDFRRAVWDELLRIPYGETTTYGELARRLGKPAAQRAVGGANHHNPIAIIIPCHRVIGADGSLTGYGGLMSRKRVLLDLEARVAPPRSRTGRASRVAADQLVLL